MTSTPPEPPNNSFVVWYDPNNDPYAVYYRTDESRWEDGENWFSADQHSSPYNEPLLWPDLCKEMDGNRGPSLLIPGGPLG